MSKTKDEIFDEMKSIYDETESSLQENSVEEKVLEGLASELYGIYCYGDYILNQAFIQTATGDSLDRHAYLRSITRKTATMATGTLTFYIDEPTESEISISKDLVCSVKNKPNLQYATLESAVIPVGETSVTVKAQALVEGSEYNVGENKITVMVNAPVGISGVYNENKFIGGYDLENDESLRKRLLNSYNFVPTGFSRQQVEDLIMNLDFVTDCRLYRNSIPGSFTACVSTKTGELTTDEYRSVLSTIPILEIFANSANVSLADTKDFSVDVVVKIKSYYDKEDIEKQVQAIIQKEYASCRIGEPFSCKNVEKGVGKIDGVEDVLVSSPQAITSTVYCDDKYKLILTEATVDCYEA